MSAYLFTLTDYHAVKEAKIRIDGLTVLAGVNGSGKSTIARWLDYIVRSLNNYESVILDEAIDEYEDLLSLINRSAQISPLIRNGWRRISSKQSVPNDDFDVARKYMMSIVDTFISFMADNVSSGIYRLNYIRLCSIFDLPNIKDETLDDFLNRLAMRLLSQIDSIYEVAGSRLKNHSIKNLKLVLEEYVDTSIDELDIKVGLSEDGVSLLSEKQFLAPLLLQNSIYFTTQSITEALQRYIRGGIRGYLFNKSEVASPGSYTLAKAVKRIIGGDVVLPENDMLNNPYELHFIREDGLNILLKGAATGVISFSHILRLLENGWLTKETILIIDEPEAHLHPQWIVEYAKILVLINKYIGTKILISTHNPDMVAAISSISERQGTGETTVFYLAKKSMDSNQYIYEDLGNEIGPIFDSFNIALDRIEQYGVAE